MALDHAAAVQRLAVLDIVPTRHVFAHADRAMATDVQGNALPCRHFLPEEAATETLDALGDFFA